MNDKTAFIEAPKKAIVSFFIWNIHLAIGRARIGQFRACVDQVAFCFREIRYLARVYPVATVWWLIGKEFLAYLTLSLARKAKIKSRCKKF